MPPIWPSCEATLMILPRLRSSIPGSTNLVHRNTPRRLTASTRSHSLTSSSAKAHWLNVPASFTRMSTWPNSARAASTMARTCCSSLTSVRIRSERRPAAAIDESTGAATSAPSRSAMTTSAPSAANAIAISPPIPRAPPVTIAVLPLSFPATLTSPQLADLVRRRQVESPGHEIHRRLMLRGIVAGHRVGDDDDVMVGEHRVTGRGLDAALRCAAGHHDRLDAVTAQQQVKIGPPERAGPVLFHHQLAVGRLKARHEQLAFGPVKGVGQRLSFAMVVIMQAQVEPDLRGGVAGLAGEHCHLDEDQHNPGLAGSADQLGDPLDHRRVHRQVNAGLIETAARPAEVALHVDD